MLIKDAKVFTDGRFVRTDVHIRGDMIYRMGAQDGRADIDGRGCYLIPGLVDIHSHGAVGQDASDADPRGLALMSGYYAQNGVTTFLATTTTYGEERLTAICECVRDFTRTGDGAKCAGVNLEGPFLSHEKRGAQNAAYLQSPDFELFLRLDSASGGRIRITDIAPELPGGLDFIHEAAGICAVSLAHTACDYETAMYAFDSGASHMTHLFNAMNPLHHRDPGPVAAACDSGAYVELICDGIHVHPAVIRMAFKLFGADRVILISDSTRCAGLPDGEYELGGQPVFLSDGRATLADGTIAGSAINIMTALRNVVGYGVPLEAAVAAATINPAASVGIDGEAGVIAEGRTADLVLLDSKLDIVNVIVDGRIVV